MSYQMLCAFLCYTAVLLIISFFAARKQGPASGPNSAARSLVGNRSINYWVTALSAHASDMSDWLFLAFPAAIYLQGGSAILIAISLIAGMFATWHFIATPLRRASEQYNAVTLISYLENRFAEHSGALRLSAALISAFFFTMYLAAGIKGIGFIGETAFGTSYQVSSLCGTGLVVAIALLGGFMAAAWTDCFQAIFLLVVVLFVPAFVASQGIGLSKILAGAETADLVLNPLANFSKLALIQMICGPIAWGLGYFGMPHIVTKFLGSANPNELYKSKYIGIAWQILALGGATAVGFVAIGYAARGTIPAEHLFITMVLEYFNPFVAGLMLCGVLAATVSTMLGQLLLVASTVAYDGYQKTINPLATDAQLMRWYRGAIICFAALAYSIAYHRNVSIFELVQYAWSGLGSSFGPLVIASLYCKKISRYGALAGMLGGAAASATWRFIDIKLAGVAINEMVPGYLVAFGAMYLVSHFTRGRA